MNCILTLCFRRSSNEHIAGGGGRTGEQKQLRRSVTLFSEVIDEDLPRSKLGEGGVVTRRRLSKAESMTIDSGKPRSRIWKRILRRQRTMGEIESPVVAPKVLQSSAAKNDKKERLKRVQSVSNLYPGFNDMHLSMSVNAYNDRNSGQNVVPMDVESFDEGMDTSGGVNEQKDNGSLCNDFKSRYEQRIEEIFLVEKRHSGTGMRLRSGNVVMKSKFKDQHPKLVRSYSVQTQSGPAYSKILDFLYVGSIETAYNEPLLCRLKIHVLVDLSNLVASQVPTAKKSNCPCPCKKENHFRSRLNVGVEDIEWENITQHFNDINNFIEGARRNNKNVLVVSYLGNSRAPTAVVQYMMRNFRLSLMDAFSLVQARRPCVSINSGFWRALQRVEKDMFMECRLPFRNPQNDARLQLGPVSSRAAWTEVK